MRVHHLLLGCTLLLVCSVLDVKSCNEAICASLVSKCMLLRSCECDMSDRNNCTCCKDCHKCLSKLYTQCCSCVGMCPETGNDVRALRSSTVEVLPDPIPALFSVLTEEADVELRWTTHNYPAHLDLLYFHPQGRDLELDMSSTIAEGDSRRVRHGQHHIHIDTNSDVQNCTVAYMSECMTLKKCEKSCQSMGAARYRWFNQYGCCECIGSTCLDFGKGEALCRNCPTADSVSREEEDDQFGEIDGRDGIDTRRPHAVLIGGDDERHRGKGRHGSRKRGRQKGNRNVVRWSEEERRNTEEQEYERDVDDL